MRVANDANDASGRARLERILDARFDGTGWTCNPDGLRHGWSKLVSSVGRTFGQRRLPGGKCRPAVCQNAAGPPPGHGRIRRKRTKE
jgi:hypothetical protein